MHLEGRKCLGNAMLYSNMSPTTQVFVRMLSDFVTSGNIKGICYCSNLEIFKAENTQEGGYIKDNLYQKVNRIPQDTLIHWKAS